MSHTSLWILSHKPSHMGVQQKYKHFDQKTKQTKNCWFSIVIAIHTTKTKTAWQMLHAFGPFQLYTQKILYLHCNSPVACTLRKVIRHMTSDFDVREIDQDMQISFSKHCAMNSEWDFCLWSDHIYFALLWQSRFRTKLSGRRLERMRREAKSWFVQTSERIKR